MTERRGRGVGVVAEVSSESRRALGLPLPGVEGSAWRLATLLTKDGSSNEMRCRFLPLDYLSLRIPEGFFHRS